MERLTTEAFSEILGRADFFDIVRLRRLGRRFRDWIDSDRLTGLLLPHFARLQAVHRVGDPFAITARRWVMMRISTQSLSGFYPLCEGVEGQDVIWAGGNRVFAIHRKGKEGELQEWDLSLGSCLVSLSLDAFFPLRVEALGSKVVVWDTHSGKVFDRVSAKIHHFDGPTSNIVGNKIATLKVLKRQIFIYDLKDLDHGVEVIETRLPPAFLTQAQIALTSEKVFLLVLDYLMVYSRVTGQLLSDNKESHAYMRMTPMGLSIAKGASRDRALRLEPSGRVLEFQNPFVAAVAGPYTIIEHVVDDKEVVSVIDPQGRYLGDLDERSYFYASDGVRLVSAVPGLPIVNVYRVRGKEMVKLDQLQIPGEPKALTFTGNQLAVLLKSGVLLRFPFVDAPQPKPKKGWRSFSSRRKQ